MPIRSEEGGNDRLDLLFLDQDAVPTLVEVKRGTDTRIRREVIGQMLDYAANAVVYLPIGMVRARFDATCRSKGREPEDVLGEFLGAEVDLEGFWQKARTNLEACKVRLLFVADVIPLKLKRVVEFLNGQMDPAEVLAIEIKQFVCQGLKTLVPSLAGQTARAEQKRAVGGNTLPNAYVAEMEGFLAADPAKAGAESKVKSVAREVTVKDGVVTLTYDFTRFTLARRKLGDNRVTFFGRARGRNRGLASKPWRRGWS